MRRRLLIDEGVVLRLIVLVEPVRDDSNAALRWLLLLLRRLLLLLRTTALLALPLPPLVKALGWVEPLTDTVNGDPMICSRA